MGAISFILIALVTLGIFYAIPELVHILVCLVCYLIIVITALSTWLLKAPGL
jgi:hypothetical protein